MNTDNFALTVNVTETVNNQHGASNSNPFAFQPLSLDLNFAGSELGSEVFSESPVSQNVRELEKIRVEFGLNREELEGNHGEDSIDSRISHSSSSCFQKMKEAMEPPQIGFNFPQGTLDLKVPDFAN